MHGERNGGKVRGRSREGKRVRVTLIQVTCAGREVTEVQRQRDLETPSTPVLGRAPPPIFTATPGCLPYYLRLPPPLPPTNHMLSLTSPPPTPRLMLHCKLNQGQTEGARGQSDSGG